MIHEIFGKGSRQVPTSTAVFAAEAVASARASIGNVGVGFDIMGQAFSAARDVVREPEPGVRLGRVSGPVKSLSRDSPAKTALPVGLRCLKPPARISLCASGSTGVR